MILLIDNYDSFTFNLYHFLGDVGAQCEVWRNDKLTVSKPWRCNPKRSCCRPDHAPRPKPASALT